jgi:hypothetical protein
MNGSILYYLLPHITSKLFVNMLEWSPELGKKLSCFFKGIWPELLEDTLESST